VSLAIGPCQAAAGPRGGPGFLRNRVSRLSDWGRALSGRSVEQREQIGLGLLHLLCGLQVGFLLRFKQQTVQRGGALERHQSRLVEQH